MTAKISVLCLILLTGCCIGAPADDTTETTTAPPLLDCGADNVCPTGYACAIIDCVPEFYNAARCGRKCLVAPTEAPTTKPPPLRNCVGPNASCDEGYVCYALDCFPQSWDDDYCGAKCVAIYTGE